MNQVQKLVRRNLVFTALIVALALVIVLSLRLRRREIATMNKIGGTRSRIFAMLTAEIVVVLALGIAAAAVLTSTAMGPI